MNCLLLFWVFFRISLLSIGGGYNMLPLMQRDLVAQGWFDDAQFVELVAVAEATPGPLAVNAATLAGLRTAGVPGLLAATAGVCAPGLLLLLPLGGFLMRHREHPVVKTTFAALLPAVAGLIFGTALRLVPHLGLAAAAPFEWTVVVLGTLALLRFRLSPALLLVLAAAAGLILRIGAF